jgi:hypothetical protein
MRRVSSEENHKMKLRVGYELRYAFPQPTPAILMLNIHFTRVVAPAAHVRISTDAVVSDTGLFRMQARFQSRSFPRRPSSFC